MRTQCQEQAVELALLVPTPGGRDGAQAEASATQVKEHRGTWPQTSTKKREIPMTKVSAATLQQDSGPGAGWLVRVSCSGIYQRRTERDNPSQAVASSTADATPKPACDLTPNHKASPKPNPSVSPKNTA